MIRNLEINHESQTIFYQSRVLFIKKDGHVNRFTLEQLQAVQSVLNQTYVLGATNLRFDNHSYEDEEENEF